MSEPPPESSKGVDTGRPPGAEAVHVRAPRRSRAGTSGNEVPLVERLLRGRVTAWVGWDPTRAGVKIKFASGGAKFHAASAEVEETDSEVRIRLQTGRRDEYVGKMLADVGAICAVVIPLSRPLADRALVEIDD